VKRYLFVAIGILVSTSPGLRGAQAATERMAFEVASVKPSPDTQVLDRFRAPIRRSLLHTLFRAGTDQLRVRTQAWTWPRIASGARHRFRREANGGL